MNRKRCGNCHHLDPSSDGDIGGLRIARRRHPKGVRIGTNPIRNDDVELDVLCAGYVVRAWHRAQPGGRHV